MPDEIVQTEAQAAPVAATQEPTPVTPEPVTLPLDDRLNLTPSQRKGLLFGQQGTPEPVTPPAEQPAEPAVPAEPVVPVVPVESPVEEPPATTVDDPVDPTGITKNFRLHTEDPKQSAFLKAYKAALAVNPNVNPADVARSVGLDVASVTSVTPAIPNIAPQVPTEIATAREEVAQLRAKLAQAKLDAKEGKLMDDTIIQLTEDYADKRAELGKIELRHEFATERQAESAANQAQTTRQSEMQAVETEFPALQDPESDLSLELDRQFFAITGDPNHPDFQKVNSKGFPAYLTEQAAAKVVARKMKQNPGMTEAQALAAAKGKATPAAPVSPVVVAPVKPNQPNPVPRTVLVTAPGGNTAPAPVPLSIEQIREQAARDPNFRKRALGFTADRIVA